MDDWRLFLGRTLGSRYTIESLEAEGGFSYVFLAHDTVNQLPVAVKVLKQHPATPAMAQIEFQIEAELLQRLSGARHVVDLIGSAANTEDIPVTATGTSISISLQYFYFALEFMDGRSLANLLPSLNSLPWLDRLNIFRDIVAGMHSMHLVHIYHRDLKAENVLLKVLSQESFVAKVSDLGRSRDIRQPAKLPEEFYRSGRGDRRFKPPECLFGAAGATEQAFYYADLYLIGSVLFELVFGHPITIDALLRPGTSLTFPEGGATLADLFQLNLSTLRAHYEQFFVEFEEQLPPPLRPSLGRLLRLLCDPDPNRRHPRNRFGRKMSITGLDWLIDRIDTCKRIANSQLSATDQYTPTRSEGVA